MGVGSRSSRRADPVPAGPEKAALTICGISSGATGTYVFRVFDECLPLPARYERGEGRGGSQNTTRRCSLLSPALSSLRYLFSAMRALCCSADFQSAVSPTCSRRSVGSVPRTRVSPRLAECNAAIQQGTTLRYDRALNTYHVGSTLERHPEAPLNRHVAGRDDYRNAAVCEAPSCSALKSPKPRSSIQCPGKFAPAMAGPSDTAALRWDAASRAALWNVAMKHR